MKKRRDLVQDVLREIGCQPKINDEDKIVFTFQGTRFFIDADDNSPFINIFETWWASIGLTNPDAEKLKIAINDANASAFPTVLYSIDEEKQLIGVHCRLRTVFMEELSNLADFMRALLDSFFKANEGVDQLMKQLAGVEDAPSTSSSPQMVSNQPVKISNKKYLVRCQKCGNTSLEFEAPRRWNGALGPRFTCEKCGESVHTQDCGTCPNCHKDIYIISKTTFKELVDIGVAFFQAYKSPISSTIRTIIKEYNTKEIASSGYCPCCGVYAWKCPDCGTWTITPKGINEMKDTIVCSKCGIGLRHG